jgi:hypothetical protein
LRSFGFQVFDLGRIYTKAHALTIRPRYCMNRQIELPFDILKAIRDPDHPGSISFENYYLGMHFSPPELEKIRSTNRYGAISAIFDLESSRLISKHAFGRG